MIQFFRIIRQKLLVENKLSRYMLYAIGEILLVMIGILLALQVNNWNTNKRNAETRQLYLRSLIAQLEENIRYTDRHIRNCDERIATFDKLFEELNQPSIDYDSLILSLENAYSRVGTSNLKVLAFEELLVSNNISIFEKELRDVLFAYHSHILWLSDNINTKLDEARKYQRSYYQTTDMAFDMGYKKNENLHVKDWRFNIDSPQYLNATNFLTYRKNILLDFKVRYTQVNGWAKKLKSELEMHLE